MLTRRLRELRDRGDAGVTLVEVMVSMTLMVIVGVIGLTFFVSTTTLSGQVAERSQVSAAARSAMNQIATTLQFSDTPTANSGYSTNRFVTISPTEVTFYSNISPTDRSGTGLRTAPTEIDYTLTNGTLWVSTYVPQGSTTPATYPASTKPTSRNQLVAGVVNQTLTPAVPVFTYCSDATDPSVTCTPTTNAASVAMVQVTLVVQGAKGTPSRTLQTGIAIDGALS